MKGPGSQPDPKSDKKGGGPDRDTLSKLFGPEKGDKAGQPQPGQQGTGPGDGSSNTVRRLGQRGQTPDPDDLDAITDPAERAAAQRLKQIRQRIQAHREQRWQPSPGSGSMSNSGNRRDW